MTISPCMSVWFQFEPSISTHSWCPCQASPFHNSMPCVRRIVRQELRKKKEELDHPPSPKLWRPGCWRSPPAHRHRRNRSFPHRPASPRHRKPLRQATRTQHILTVSYRTPFTRRVHVRPSHERATRIQRVPNYTPWTVPCQGKTRNLPHTHATNAR